MPKSSDTAPLNEVISNLSSMLNQWYMDTDLYHRIRIILLDPDPYKKYVLDTDWLNI